MGHKELRFFSPPFPFSCATSITNNELWLSCFGCGTEFCTREKSMAKGFGYTIVISALCLARVWEKRNLGAFVTQRTKSSNPTIFFRGAVRAGFLPRCDSYPSPFKARHRRRGGVCEGPWHKRRRAGSWERSAPGAPVSFDLVFCFKRRTGGGCRGGRGVVFTATSSSLPLKWLNGEVR